MKDWIIRKNTLEASARLTKKVATEDPKAYKNFMRLLTERF